MVEQTGASSPNEDVRARVAAIVARLAEIRERIDRRCDRGQAVQLVAVTKRFPNEVAAAAVLAGCADLGENYGQELVSKAEAVQALASTLGFDPPRWHMIGPVQRNKVKKMVDHVALWHTIDRSALVAELANRAPAAAVLVQVNTTGEDAKSGVAPGGVAALVAEARERGLEVRGLMTMGPTDASVDPRPAFALCRRLADEAGLADCSMGMSGDFEAAVEEGATIVRIGSGIFGPRPS